MRPVVINIAVLADDADGICASQAPLAAGYLLINGVLAVSGAVTLPAAQIITVTSDDDDSVNNFTIAGFDPGGQAISQTIAGPNAGAEVTTFFYGIVTSVYISGAAVGNITVGVAAADGMASPPIPVDYMQHTFGVGLQFDLTAGTMTASAQFTMDDPWGEYENSFSSDARWTAVTGISGVTASAAVQLSIRARAVRFVESIGSATGAGKFTVLQSIV